MDNTWSQSSTIHTYLLTLHIQRQASFPKPPCLGLSPHVLPATIPSDSSRRGVAWIRRFATGWRSSYYWVTYKDLQMDFVSWIFFIRLDWFLGKKNQKKKKNQHNDVCIILVSPELTFVGQENHLKNKLNSLFWGGGRQRVGRKCARDLSMIIVQFLTKKANSFYFAFQLGIFFIWKGKPPVSHLRLRVQTRIILSVRVASLSL